MNKDELLEELKHVKELLEKEKKNNDFLIKQQRQFKEMAEKAGSEMGEFKHKCIRLEEELKRFKN